MKNSADLGGYYPSRPSASVDNTLLDLQNSSYPTQPHSIIANYEATLGISIPTSTLPYMDLLVHYEQRLSPHPSSFVSLPFQLPGGSYPTNGVREDSEDSTSYPGDNKMFLARVHPHTLRP